MQSRKYRLSLRTGYVDEKAESLEEALGMIKSWTTLDSRICWLAWKCCNYFHTNFRNGYQTRYCNDQTSAHDPTNGYLPENWSISEWKDKRESNPKLVEAEARKSMKKHVEAMVSFWNKGCQHLIMAIISGK